jgi:hypothetical protein
MHRPRPRSRVQSSVLYETYQAWTKAAGEYEWKQKGFSQALKAKGLAAKASNGMHWLGMRLVKTRHDFVDVHGNVMKWTPTIADRRRPRPSATPAPPADDYDDALPGSNPSIWKGAEGSAEGRKRRKSAALEGLEGSPDNSAHTGAGTGAGTHGQ